MIKISISLSLLDWTKVISVTTSKRRRAIHALGPETKTQGCKPLLNIRWEGHSFERNQPSTDHLLPR